MFIFKKLDAIFNTNFYLYYENNFSCDASFILVLFVFCLVSYIFFVKKSRTLNLIFFFILENVSQALIFSCFKSVLILVLVGIFAKVIHDLKIKHIVELTRVCMLIQVWFKENQHLLFAVVNVLIFFLLSSIPIV